MALAKRPHPGDISTISQHPESAAFDHESSHDAPVSKFRCCLRYRGRRFSADCGPQPFGRDTFRPIVAQTPKGRLFRRSLVLELRNAIPSIEPNRAGSSAFQMKLHQAAMQCRIRTVPVIASGFPNVVDFVHVAAIRSR